MKLRDVGRRAETIGQQIATVHADSDNRGVGETLQKIVPNVHCLSSKRPENSGQLVVINKALTNLQFRG